MTDEIDIRLRYGQQAGDITVTGLSNVINESISQILETRRGTRLFNRNLGSSLGSLLFEPMTALTARIILIEIQQAIESQEPRVRVLFNRSSVRALFDENRYEVRIGYQIIDSEDTGEFNTFLEAGLN